MDTCNVRQLTLWESIGRRNPPCLDCGGMVEGRGRLVNSRWADPDNRFHCNTQLSSPLHMDRREGGREGGIKLERMEEKKGKEGKEESSVYGLM